MTTDNKVNSKILIVDDVPQNIQVLANILKDAGYQMGFAKDAKTALAHIESTQFDLILLDIMMPEIDGYEVCARLKEDKKKKDIPVIFVTAKGETADKTKGFELGAVDYITKPFDVQEVLARVKTHLTIRNYATKLEQMVEERTRQLIHADRLATLGTFSAAIVHEINNPLSHVMGNAKLLKFLWNSLKPIVERHLEEFGEGKSLTDHEDATCGERKSDRMGRGRTEIVRNGDETMMTPEDETMTAREDTTVAVVEDDQTAMMLRRDMDSVDEALINLLNGCHRIFRLANSLRAYSCQNYARKGKAPLVAIINDALQVVIHKLKFRGITVDIDVPSQLTIFCDQQQISQVFINLIDNACDAMKGHSGEITVSATPVNSKNDQNYQSNQSKRSNRSNRADQDDQEAQDAQDAQDAKNNQKAQNDLNDQNAQIGQNDLIDLIDIKIADNGPGILDEVGDKIFDPFFTSKGKDEGTGLGLFIVRNIIEEHQGKIVLSPFNGKGAEFHIFLPLA